MQAATVIAYIFISRLYRKTWDSVHVELWHDWGLWFRLAIPGMLMSGLEWWVCESGSLVSGLRGEQALAAQTIINNIESVIYCTFPLGFGIASTIRIGQFLGANKAVGPRSTALVALAMIAFTTVINAFILTFARYQIPRIFTNDRGVIEMFVDSIVGVASGIIRGVGMQQVGAIVCGVCMYLVGGPIGLCLLLLTDLSVAGFWWGLTAGMGLESIIYVILILKIDWNDMCTKAAKRTEIKFVHAVPGQREIEIKDDDVREDVLPETSDFHEERVEACTPVIIFTRATMISVSFLMLVIALLCRFLFNWKAYFPTYCLLGNGTVIQVPLVDDKLNAFWNGTSCVRIIP
uniref:Multidrug resistance protein, MATE family n=1 Tax=Mesocestoides corti TaxID=53468 RepID=A0A5K3EXB1_MESCO